MEQDPTTPIQPTSVPQTGDRRQQAVLGAAVLILIGACGLWIYHAMQPAEDDSPLPRKGPPSQFAKVDDSRNPEPIPPPRGLPGHSLPGHGLPDKSPKGNPGGNFLESFVEKVKDPAEVIKGPAPTNPHLQKRFDGLLTLQDQIMDVERRLPPPADPKDPKAPKPDEKLLAQFKKLTAQWSDEVAVFDKELRQARGSRPDDPVPEWLTGELLILVRGEPELILPYFERARKAGLDHARLWASLARVQIEGNRFTAALQSALKAYDKAKREPYVWNALARAGLSAEDPQLVIDKLKQAFPEGPLPDFAKLVRKDADELLALTKEETRLRQADRDRDDLPRVRFTIEHRKFVLDNGKPTAKIDASPGGEVVVELFEDQAPNTVANFIDLVEKKFYDGTKFCLAEPASLVLGGCPRTKNADPADDGTGGPDYVIADEFKLKNARKHFRGSLCMANSGRPDSAGSQFYMTLTPQPTMNGLFTVFGRVIKGQDVVDRITTGRTNLDVGPFGRIIPGDALIRAEVIRKRPHAYTVKKIKSEK